MDRNSIIGIVLICVVLLVFSFLNQPSKEQLQVQKNYADSISLVEQKVKDSLLTVSKNIIAPEASKIAADTLLSDSAKAVALQQQFGSFAQASSGTEQLFTIENEELKITLSTKGGIIKTAELKKYKTYDGKPIELNNSDSGRFSLNFFSQNKTVSTADLFFEPVGSSFIVSGTQEKSFALRLNAGAGKYLEYVYKLKGTDFMLGYNVNFVNMQEVIAANSSYIELDWKQRVAKFEKDPTLEKNVTTVYYRYTDEEVGNLSETADEEADLKTKVNWVGFKQQFFSTVLIANKNFERPTKISSVALTDSAYVKYLAANFTIPFSHKPAETFDMTFYFGPNHYNTLKKYGIGLEKLVPLGWGIFGWVNKFAVIPVFNFLNGFNLNYGIIIVLLTLFLKIILLPLTFKSYMSTAKMRVLQPEVAEIQAKKKDDPLKLQQETMQLYRKAGVNPLGGCIPMLLQLPILIAMFRFFPASFELRQEPFLWAKDLSTYDSVLNLNFAIPFYGSHVSMFAILMTISTILYTKMNSSQMPQTGPNAQMMKWMMYIMPIVFLGVMNSYSAGLSYYIFVANMITFGQQWLFKRFVDENAIHAKIQENKKKPIKRSAFQERLEKMAKERGVKMK
jgi:YidC/Oxa1 family membrane protein insertase